MMHCKHCWSKKAKLKSLLQVVTVYSSIHSTTQPLSAPLIHQSHNRSRSQSRLILGKRWCALWTGLTHRAAIIHAHILPRCCTVIWIIKIRWIPQVEFQEAWAVNVFSMPLVNDHLWQVQNNYRYTALEMWLVRTEIWICSVDRTWSKCHYGYMIILYK